MGSQLGYLYPAQEGGNAQDRRSSSSSKDERVATKRLQAMSRIVEDGQLLTALSCALSKEQPPMLCDANEQGEGREEGRERRRKRVRRRLP
jgi:hypothetical protein